MWVNKKRKRNRLDIRELYKEFSEGKQTYGELSFKYGISIRKVQEYLDSFIPHSRESSPKEVVLLIDTTYFGSFGVIVFKDKESKSILHREIVQYETNAAYKQ